MPCVEPDAPDADALPSIDALVAGTFALMTTWADPCPHAPLPQADLRRLLARKVVSNLFFLQHHPLLRPEMRHCMAQAHARWVGLAQSVPLPPHATAMPATGDHALH